MTEKRKSTALPESSGKTKKKTQAMSRTSEHKKKDPQSAKKKLSARVAALAQKDKKKEEVVKSMKRTQRDGNFQAVPRLKPLGEDDNKNRYFKALGDRIANRAYEIYESRGGGHGHDFEDWLEAERQVLSEEATG